MPDVSLTTLFFLCTAVFGVGFSLGWLLRLSGISLVRKREREETEKTGNPE